MKNLLGIFVFAVVWLSGPSVAWSADGFPFRARYPDAPVMDTQNLKQRLHNVAIVDVRSDYEHRTLRIKGAINISLSAPDFTARVRALREKTANAIVFYCNGVTCVKSYDATLLAKNNRVADVYAYDASVMAWAKAYPDHTELLGKSPVRAEDLIDKARFDARSVTPEAFAAKVGSSAIIVDVRDRIQRDNPLYPLMERKASLNQVAQLAAIIDEAKAARKTLLIYDAAGKQVQWFQYELEARGLKDYFFMKGGADAYWEHRFGKSAIAKAKAAPK